MSLSTSRPQLGHVRGRSSLLTAYGLEEEEAAMDADARQCEVKGDGRAWGREIGLFYYDAIKSRGTFPYVHFPFYLMNKFETFFCFAL